MQKTRQIEAFGKKVTATATHLMGDASATEHYPNAIASISRQMRRPGLQRSIFSQLGTAPSELVRSKISTSEIAHRALTYLPDELLHNIPESENTYSLFQGFQASVPEGESEHRKGHRRRASKAQKLLADGSADAGPPTIEGLKKTRNTLNHRLEMMGIRKNMCGTEIREIDNKISNLNHMRKIVLDRLKQLEDDETTLEHDLMELEDKLETLQEEAEDAAALATDALDHSTPTLAPIKAPESPEEAEAMDASFMSESIYQKLPSPTTPSKKRRPKPVKRKSMPILHEHLESGSSIRFLSAHTDAITAFDFDTPFGTMVTAAMDDTVKVWDLNLGRCMGLLEGHTASVRCLNVEDNIVATGGMDASIRLWDLNQARYEPFEHDANGDGDDDGLGFGNFDEDEPPPPPADAMSECLLFVLESHVDTVTALHLRGDILVSGSADKTLRQWDLVKGRCVQTLDVLWAAAQAATIAPSLNDTYKPTGRASDSNADFVGALQCFDAALACGTADGMVRLWDLRSGQVHRSLVGHTGPVTCLQFDDVHLVTGSADRSIRVSLGLVLHSLLLMCF